MAMPASGCLGICTCPGGACTSISQAVSGNVTPPKSLCALSIAAGKSAPHAMTEFYGYATTTTTTTTTAAPTNYVDVAFNYQGGGDCMYGNVYLMCCNNTYVCSELINSNGYQQVSFTNVPVGCYYIDSSNVCSELASTPIPTTYTWYDNFGSGGSAYTNCFTGDNVIDFYINDNM